MGSQSSLGDISSAIRQEIIRFESVHPSIYAIYDLVDTLDDKNLAESLRQLVVSIEDAFVNSQEWTLSHNVPDIKLGLLGSVQSGKSALVHRYLTGTYMHDESPEGGRFKKELSLENQSHLLLIRDEGGPPDQQFSHWIDGVIFVFSLENFESYQLVYEYYTRLSKHRNLTGLPIFLVGTQDSNCESYARIIDDTRARKLANDLNHCAYYETCAAYGLNVERVFRDACLKILQVRTATNLSIPRPVTPQMSSAQHRPLSNSPADSGSITMSSNQSQQSLFSHAACTRELPVTSKNSVAPTVVNTTGIIPTSTASDKGMRPIPTQNLPTLRVDAHSNPVFEPDFTEECKGENNESLTPSSTPTHSRKNRRKSNLFLKKTDDERDRDKKLNGIGSGRAIPLKQGFLYKRSYKPLSKEWKTKKYVTLTDDARLTYHPSIHDYMDNTHGKEIDLSRTTVKIPGVAFRQVGCHISSNGLLRTPQLSETDRRNTAIDSKLNNDSGTNKDTISSGIKDAASVKKRHRRIKSNPKTNTADGSDSEGYEFQLISMDRQWHFEASGPDERDDWVMHIERAIMTRLQLNESNKRTRCLATASSLGLSSNMGSGIGTGIGNRSSNIDTQNRNICGADRSGAGDANELAVTDHFIQSIRSTAGNDYCADCGASEPDWASLNLGAMVCISCSGIHRQLGTHISRIRSLHLDEWSPESVSVMSAIGNTLANSVWEAAVPVNAGNRKKPEPNSSREEKEIWIRAKYDRQEFLPPLPYPDAPLQQQLIDAIARQDTRQVILCLALATPETVNAAYSRQDPRAAIHIAATLGNLVYLQLLLWYNGDPTVTDHEGRNAFYYAHCSQKYNCAEFLLRNGCPKQMVPPMTLLPSLRSSQPNPSQSVHNPLIPISLPVATDGMPAPLQPHHFSHLQQHQPTSNTNSLLSSSSTLTNQLGTAAYHQYPQLSATNNPTTAPLLQGAPGHSFVPVTFNNYNTNVNQVLGATLPRRRAPIGPFGAAGAPTVLQPFARPTLPQQPVINVTPRPNSTAVIPVTKPAILSRKPNISVTQPVPPPHSRPTTTTSGGGQSPATQPFLQPKKQELGL